MTTRGGVSPRATDARRSAARAASRRGDARQSFRDLHVAARCSNRAEAAENAGYRARGSAAARTKEALWEAIGRHLDEFTAEECQNYLAHSGYEP